jgi:chemotaxis protein histidine kinase CheA
MLPGQPHGWRVSPLPVLDRTVFQELREGVAQQLPTLASIYRTFDSNAERLIDEIAVESGAPRAKLLHTLKGSAAMMGASRIAKLASDLQEAYAFMPAHAMSDGIRQLERELFDFRGAISAHLESLGWSPPARSEPVS